MLITYHRCDYSKSFEVVVGTEGKKFSVYYYKAANQSDYFKAARSSQWNKDPQVPIDLSYTDPSTFQDYLKLVYTGEFDEPDTEIPHSTKDCSPAERDVIRIASESYFQKLASLYVLADKLQDSTSANSVMDHLLIFSDASDFLIPVPTLAWVYEHTP